MVKAISILGSTGSIGRQTAQAAGRLGIPVLALAARRDVDRLEEQARQFRPKYISVMDSAAAKELRSRAMVGMVRAFAPVFVPAGS